MQNAYIERKNGSMRRELLNAYLFASLNEVRALSEEWRIYYNTERPHKSLGYLSPFQYALAKRSNPALSTPANETSNQIEAQPVVDKASKHKKKTTFENSN